VPVIYRKEDDDENEFAYGVKCKTGNKICSISFGNRGWNWFGFDNHKCEVKPDLEKLGELAAEVKPLSVSSALRNSSLIVTNEVNKCG
jgi:hypothetical protein